MSRAQPGQCRSQAQLSLVQNVPDGPFLDSDWWTLTKYSEETPHITAPSFLFTAAVQTDLQHTAACQLYRDYLQLRKLHSKVPPCTTALYCRIGPQSCVCSFGTKKLFRI